MKNVTTADRLKQIMSERGIKQIDILEACNPYCEKYGIKINKSHLSQYVSGSVQPGQDKLSILGMALNVSEAWLMGYDVSKERDNEIHSLSPDEKKLIDAYRNFNDEGKEKVLDTITDMLQLDRYKKCAESDVV